MSAGSILDDLRADPSRVALAVRQALLAETEADVPVEAQARRGAMPLAQLLSQPRARAPGRRLVVVVDQFEEVFTAGADEAERLAFIRALHAAAIGNPHDGGAPPALVVLGLRAGNVN